MVKTCLQKGSNPLESETIDISQEMLVCRMAQESVA